MGMLQGGLLSQVVAGGDTIDLQAMAAAHEAVDGAAAMCRAYGTLGTTDGEQWYEDGGWTYQNDFIDPVSNVGNYQMKWDALSGDAPTNVSTPEGVWESLGSDHFDVEWTASGANESVGSVTVSIREGTGSVLDTAIWTGEAISTKKGQ